MSHFTVIRTQITDTEALVTALADLGLKHVEIHDTAQHLYGFQGDIRPQTAEVIIRREFIGPSSNDVGFKRNATGAFDAIISGYDRRRFSRRWLGRLTQRYAYHVAKARLSEQGFDLVSEEARPDKTICLRLRRMA
jgi:hypothetical protein